MYSLLLRLWKHISPRRRWQLGALIGLMVLGAVAEVISLGMMLPFLGVLTAPDNIFANPLARPFIVALGLTSPSQMLLPLTVLFAVAAMISGVSRLSLLWMQMHLGNAIGNDLGSEALHRTLYQPYSVHCARNSSEVIAVLMIKVNTVVNHVMIPLLAMITSALIVSTIVAFMLYIDPRLTSISFFGFGVLYLVVAVLTKKRLIIDGQRITQGQDKVTKVVQEGLGGIKDVLINGLQEIYHDLYRRIDRDLRKAYANISIIAGTPRPIIESFGLAFIAVFAYSLSNRAEGVATAIPTLGALALSAQRLLPLVQQGYAGWASMLGSQSSLRDVLALLEQPMPGYYTQKSIAPITFNALIRINNISFRYNAEGPQILNHINLTIPKGSRIGFVGATGSGKSTLLDIIMGLLPPGSGSIQVDKTVINEENQRAWQTHIAHVQQSVFLTDTTIAENIAFGVAKDQIDLNKVREAAEKAQIASTIESWEKGYDTFVGERGIRLSGGQRQRIGIARALYRQADVIVFDEATSALDSDTEQAVIESFKLLGKELTILIVAHRVTTLQHCDLIVEVKDGMIQELGTYQEFTTKLPMKHSNSH